MENMLNRIAVKERYKACRSLFEQIAFPYAVIKGAVLSHMAYGDPFVRHSGDIDLLIRRKDADDLKALLLSLGFVQGRITDGGIVPFSRREILFQTKASHQTAPYVKSTGNRLCPYVNVDVNTDILWGESEEKADMDAVLANTERTVLLDVPFPKLTSEMELISLCLHHYKDMHSLYLLSGGSLRLSLFCDLYYYLRNVRPNAEKLRVLAHTLRVGQYVYACLYDTQTIFDDPLLVPYLDALESERDASLLDTLGLSEKEKKPWGLTLPERLLHPDLPHYIEGLLTEEEKQKVAINRQYM